MGLGGVLARARAAARAAPPRPRGAARRARRARRARPSAQGTDDAPDTSGSEDLLAELAARRQELGAQKRERWRSGKCAQRVVLAPGDWIRCLDLRWPHVACGTAHGAVLVADVAQNCVRALAPPGSHRRAEREDTDSRWRVLGTHDPRSAVTALALGAAPGGAQSPQAEPGLMIVTGGREGGLKLWRWARGGDGQSVVDADAAAGEAAPRAVPDAGELGAVGALLGGGSTTAASAPELELLGYAHHPDVVAAVAIDEEEQSAGGDVNVWTCCVDGRVRLWRASTGATSLGGGMELMASTDVGAPALCLAMLPRGAPGMGGAVAVAGLAGGRCVLLDARGNLVGEGFGGEESSDDIRSVAVAVGGFSLGLEGEDEELAIVTGNSKGGIDGWRAADTQPAGGGAMVLARQLRGHAGPVVSLSFSTEAGTLVSGALDGTIRVWDAKAGSALYAIMGHTAYLTTVATDADRIVADGSNDVIVLHSFES